MLRGLFIRIDVHIGLILTNLIYETLNIHKILIYLSSKLECINVIRHCVSVERTHHLINDTGFEIRISRRLYSARSICVCYILNVSRLVYVYFFSHRSNPDEYHIRDVKYTYNSYLFPRSKLACMNVM